MGGVLGVKIEFSGAKIEDKELEDKDDRRRNSLAFYITQFINYDGDDFNVLVENVKKDKFSKTGGKPPAVRASKFNKIADAIMSGDMKELRNQVFVDLKTINRKYKDQHVGNTILHMACQEGYFNMVNYMFNPSNYSGLDSTEVEISPKNDRSRIPLFLCFTPPSATFNGFKNGLDEDGNVIAAKPDEIEQFNDWCKPGGPKSRENCIKFLLERGANVNERDYQDFTALHFASMWGWISTVRLLIDHGADINAVTVSGRTPLMYAVEFDHEPLVFWFAENSKKLGLQLDTTDADGYTALILAVEKGTEGHNMAKALVQKGSDPNVLTLRRKTALKIACAAQDIKMVNLLLDYNVQRRNSAFCLLKEDLFAAVQARIVEEEKKLEEEKNQNSNNNGSFQKEGGTRRKNPFEAWIEYRDKRTKKPFYYNTVTRKSTFDKPKDFKIDKKRIIKEAMFGMSFYH